MMIFKAPYPDSTYILTLPSPSLNDVRRLTLDQEIRRNLNHEIITYIKRNNNKQYTWQFLVSVAKKWEAYYFMREYAEQKMQVITHKDKVLVGYLINGSHHYTAERRGDYPTGIHEYGSPGDIITEELWSVTIDFVGDVL